MLNRITHSSLGKLGRLVHTVVTALTLWSRRSYWVIILRHGRHGAHTGSSFCVTVVTALILGARCKRVAVAGADGAHRCRHGRCAEHARRRQRASRSRRRALACLQGASRVPCGHRPGGGRCPMVPKHGRVPPAVPQTDRRAGAGRSLLVCAETVNVRTASRSLFASQVCLYCPSRGWPVPAGLGRVRASDDRPMAPKRRGASGRPACVHIHIVLAFVSFSHRCPWASPGRLPAGRAAAAALRWRRVAETGARIRGAARRLGGSAGRWGLKHCATRRGRGMITRRRGMITRRRGMITSTTLTRGRRAA